MKQYFNVDNNNNCPTCGGKTKSTGMLFLTGMIREDSICTKCGHSLMTLFTIESIVDEDAVDTEVKAK